jgi:3-isopropylmalate/(R)-2-methylmalate dehydratase large subunit
MAKSLFDKIWETHVVTQRSDGRDILYMDRHVSHDLHAPRAFGRLGKAGRKVRRPDLTFAALDHSISSRRKVDGGPIDTMFTIGSREGAKKFGVRVFDLEDPEHGISHVVGPELGLILPGSTYACPDSHACTVGGLGAFAYGCGTSELEHVFATQALAIKKPKSLRINLYGTMAFGITAKDVVLKIIATCGVNIGRGYAIEYAGPIAEALSIEGRLTLCNMAIEMGARSGFVAPDEKTIKWLEGRAWAPTGDKWDAAVIHWRTLKSDEGAKFDKEVSVDCGGLEPQISWGIDPSQIIGISDIVPDPIDKDEKQKVAMERALQYMGLKPGMSLKGLPINQVFIGSCTNSRLPDLEAAAGILKGRKVAKGIKALVVPGSAATKRQAEAKGLDKIFIEAGFFWGEAGCSMCAGGIGDSVDAGDRSVSTTNRNFENRQGPAVRTHLVSPAMAAAAAVTGEITDVRELIAKGE